MIKGVIFDMDGVMFDTERLMKQGWEYAGREMGFSLTEEQMFQMRGGSKEQNARLFQEWFQGEVSYETGRIYRADYVNDFIRRHSVPVKKGLFQLLQFLKEQKIPAAVATSTHRAQAEEYWRLAKVTPYLSASVCGDEVSRGKPDPEIFLTAAKKLGIPPADCLILEDSYNGLKAACAAGAFSCMVPDLTPYSQIFAPVCSQVCDSLLCVPDLIQKQNRNSP